MQNIKRNFIASICTITMMIFAGINVQAQDVRNQNNQNQQNDVLEIIQSSEEHTIFAGLIQQANMNEELQGENIIVTAPTDEAFENMEEDINQLRQDPQRLEEFLDNHIENNELDGAYADSPREGAEQNRQQGQAGADEVRVIPASNGEVHVVNKVKTDKNKDNNKNETDDDWDN